MFWTTGTARLLPRVIGTRTTGPLCLAAKRPTRPMPVTDLDPETGRARPSYRQAARLFAAAGARIDPTGAPWTLHRLRHDRHHPRRGSRLVTGAGPGEEPARLTAVTGGVHQPVGRVGRGNSLPAPTWVSATSGTTAGRAERPSTPTQPVD